MASSASSGSPSPVITMISGEDRAALIFGMISKPLPSGKLDVDKNDVERLGLDFPEPLSECVGIKRSDAPTG